MALFFFSCTDTYKRVGDEAVKKIYPTGVAQDFVLTSTETDDKEGIDNKEARLQSRVVVVLKSPLCNDFDNLEFPHLTFPKGLVVEFFDEKGEKSTISADYGIIYSKTNLIDLQGNVIIETSDGKRLESPQLYWDRANEWIFTQEKFTFINPEDGTVMDGEGMDFNRDLSFFNAHRTYGLMSIKEE